MSNRNEIARSFLKFCKERNLKAGIEQQDGEVLDGKTYLELSFDDYGIIIPDDMKWHAIHRSLLNRIKSTAAAAASSSELECLICNEKCSTGTQGCSECGNEWCTECEIKKMLKDKGLSKCPFCRFQFGPVFEKMNIECHQYILLRTAHLRSSKIFRDETDPDWPTTTIFTRDGEIFIQPNLITIGGSTYFDHPDGTIRKGTILVNKRLGIN